MLTLEFNNTITAETIYSRNDTYYVHPGDLRPLTGFRFSPSSNQLPYIVSANPSLHKKGLLYFSNNTPFGNRGLNMIKLKEILENAPVAIRVKLLSDVYIVGKGFIAKVTQRDNWRDPRLLNNQLNDKVELMFVVASETGRVVSSPHDLKIYLNREMYEPQYKRVMALLKPYMADHKGDIIVTKSINNYLLYQFQYPSFHSITQRVKFDENMKEFFFRSIKWNKWRVEEEIRIEEAEKQAEIKRQKDLRERTIQERILSVINEEDIRISQAVIEAELVEEVPLVGESVTSNTARIIGQMELIAEQEASLREVTGITAEGITAERSGQTPQPHSTHLTPEQVQQRLESLRGGRQQQEALSHSTHLTPEQLSTTQQLPQELELDIHGNNMNTGQMEPMEQLDQQDMPSELTLTVEQWEEQVRRSGIVWVDSGNQTVRNSEMQDSPELSQPSENNLETAQQAMQQPPETPLMQSGQGEYVSPEEMERIMNQFAIAPPVEIQYSTLLHAATGIPVDQIEHISELEVNEDTEIEINDDEIFDEPDEEELERLHSASEEELDNDPDAYQDAEIVH